MFQINDDNDDDDVDGGAAHTAHSPSKFTQNQT